MKLILNKRMFFAGAWRDPGPYVIGKIASMTDAKCAVADGFGQIVTDKRDGAPENKQLGAAPENKIDNATLENGDRSSAGTVADAGSSGENPLLSGAGGSRKRRVSKSPKR